MEIFLYVHVAAYRLLSAKYRDSIAHVCTFLYNPLFPSFLYQPLPFSVLYLVKFTIDVTQWAQDSH